MTRNTPASISLLFLLVGCATAHPEPDPKLAQIENGLRPLVLVEGDRTWTIAERMLEYGVPGLSIAIIRDGRIDWVKGYGSADLEAGAPVTVETLFQAGSISKGVSAMGALALVERGRLTLDGDINDVLTSWSVPSNEHTAIAPVTLDGLLSHTAGLSVHGFPGYEAGTSVPTVLQVLDATPPVNTPPVRVILDPGTEYRYSGGGYTVAQLAMTDVTGKPFPQLMQELVLGPLGMTSSTYEQPLPAARMTRAAAGYREDGSPVPGKRHVYPEMAAAGLWTTPSDVARFAISVQQMSRGEPGPLRSASVANMLTPRRSNYGLGLEQEGSYFLHGGADDGFRALLYAHRTKDYGIVLMTNSDNGVELMREVLFAAGAAYGWDEFDSGPVKVATVSPETLAAYAGRYAMDKAAVLTLSVDGAGLRGAVSLTPPLDFVPVSEHEFVCRAMDVRLLFEGGELTLDDFGDRTLLPRLGADAQLADDALESGRLDAAVTLYRRLRDANAEDPAIAEQRLNEHGATLLARQDVRAAIAILELNVEFHPDSATGYEGLAGAMEAAGERSRAVALYRKANELASREAEFWLHRNASVRARVTARLQVLGS